MGVLTHLDYFKENKYVRKKKKIEEYVDKHESFELNEGRMDLFYGNNRVFITIYAPARLKEIVMGKQIL